MEVKEFKRRLTELESLIAEGLGYFRTWATLFDRDEETANALNRYRGFFLPVQNSLKDMALLQFAKAFDHDPRTSSLRTLLREAQMCRNELTPYATEDDLNNLESQINGNEELLERLKGFRDKRLAHNDANYERRQLLYGEMTKLADDMQSMFDSLSAWHDSTEVSFHLIIEDAEKHTAEVVQIIREERDRASSKRRKTTN